MMTASVYVSVCVCLRVKDLGESPFRSECVFACLCGLMTVNMCSNAKKKIAKTNNFCSTRHAVFYVAPSHVDYRRYNFFCGFIQQALSSYMLPSLIHYSVYYHCLI